MRLLIISNMAHYREGDRVLGWEPGVREIDHLAEAFDEVRHIAMLHRGAPPPTSAPYSSPKVTLVPLSPSGGRGLWSKLGILLRSPSYLAACWRQLRDADAVHVRCPANISLEALLLLRFLARPKLRWAKYAGNWRPVGREPLAYRLQRRWLERGIHKGLVTVNGKWHNQPAHVFSFSNPSFSQAEFEHAKAETRDKQLGQPLRLLFAGRFLPSKGAGRALHILGGLRDSGVDARLDLAGDGPEAAHLKRMTTQLGLCERVRFHGWLPRADLDALYRQAHILLLPSATEGWPKVLSEAMAFRVVPVAGAVSCIPQTLGNGEAGIALPVDDIHGFVAAIAQLARDPAEWLRVAANAQEAASAFTYESYVERVCKLLQIEPERRALPFADYKADALAAIETP